MVNEDFTLFVYIQNAENDTGNSKLPPNPPKNVTPPHPQPHPHTTPFLDPPCIHLDLPMQWGLGSGSGLSRRPTAWSLNKEQ